MFSPQSVTEILREGFNRNDDETADYDGMRDPIEPWDGTTYAVGKDKRNPSSVETLKSPMLSISLPISNNSNTSFCIKTQTTLRYFTSAQDFHDIIDRREELEKKFKEVVGNVSVI